MQRTLVIYRRCTRFDAEFATALSNRMLEPMPAKPYRSLLRSRGFDWNRFVSVRVVGLSLASVGLLLTLGGCSTLVLEPQGPVGAGQRIILLNSLFLMLALVVPIIVATLAFAWWFRASNSRAEYRPDWAYSGRLEILVWSVPLLMVMFLGGITWIGSHDLDPGKPLASQAKPLQVQVVSLDWKWLFIYPDHGVATVNELVLPAGRPVTFSLTSASVMNAFFIPQLGSMIYTMARMTTKLNLQADHPGEYLGLSSHFSGDGFPAMHFKVRSVPTGDFDRFIEDAKASDRDLDANAYRELLKQTIGYPTSRFRAVEPELFNAIVTEKLPYGPGPEPAIHPKQGGEASGPAGGEASALRLEAISAAEASICSAN